VDIYCTQTNTRLCLETQKRFFVQILDRLLKAPINLYFDITPIGRILGYFNEDLTAVDEHFFNLAKEIVANNLHLVLITIKSAWSLPQLIPVFVYYVYVSYRNRCLHQAVCDTQWRLMGSTNEKSVVHCKLSYSGREVINAHNKSED